MKKIVLFLFLFSAVMTSVFAQIEVMPYYTSSIKRAGVGFTLVHSPLIMRQEAKNDGKILETLNFDFKSEPQCSINKQKCNLDDIFVVYKEDKKLAILSTIDETEGWSLVCFNQAESPVCGWVEESKNKYYTTREFFDYYGKKYGMYFFKDVQKPDRTMYSAPVKQTNSLGVADMPRHIAPWLFQGNWVLTKVLDFGNSQKTGWLNYRNDNGKLKMFVNF